MLGASFCIRTILCTWHLSIPPSYNGKCCQSLSTIHHHSSSVYFHTTCYGSITSPLQPRPIHTTCHCHCRCQRRCRRRRRNLRHCRRRHRHRLTATVAFATTFSSLYLVDCCLYPPSALLPPLSSSSPLPLSQSPLLSPPTPPPWPSSLLL